MINDFSLTIENRDGMIFNGNVAYLSSRNETGKFDILPTHANFITLLMGNIEIHLPDGKIQNIPADNAVLKFENNSCEVFLGIKQVLAG